MIDLPPQGIRDAEAAAFARVIAEHPRPAIEPTVIPMDADGRTLRPLGLIMSKARSPGIVFGLNEVDYHADPSLGSTSFKNLMRSAADFHWDSVFNPRREPRPESKDLLWGTAFHTIVLEGRTVFDRKFACMPEEVEYPIIIKTAADCKAFLESEGVAVKSGILKPALIERVRTLWASIKDQKRTNYIIPKRHPGFDPKSPLWDDILEATANGRTLLARNVYEKIVLNAMMVTAHPELSHWLGRQDQALADGRPREGYTEVSIFWREPIALQDGSVLEVPCKARFDYLGLRATVDLKTIETRGSALGLAIPRQIWTLCYDIQAAHYTRGREVARDLVAQGKVEVLGDHAPVPSDWLKAFSLIEPLLPEDPADKPFAWTWMWVWVPKKGAPISEGLRLRYGSDLAQLADDYRSAMLHRFATSYVVKGEADVWVHYKPVRDLTLADMPTFPRFDADQVDDVVS
jgi:hypothetical protein